jgi:hypothetical protein
MQLKIKWVEIGENKEQLTPWAFQTRVHHEDSRLDNYSSIRLH